MHDVRTSPICCRFTHASPTHPHWPQRERYITFLQGIPILQTLSHEELLTVADALQSVRPGVLLSFATSAWWRSAVGRYLWVTGSDVNSFFVHLLDPWLWSTFFCFLNGWVTRQYSV
jgi:hypothetical protein